LKAHYDGQQAHIHRIFYAVNSVAEKKRFTSLITAALAANYATTDRLATQNGRQQFTLK